MTCMVFRRHVHANRLQGIDNEWLTPAAGGGVLSAAGCRPSGRGIRFSVRHCNGAAGWRGMTRSPGAMRAPPRAYGVDIIQNCAVTGVARDAIGGGHRS